MRMRCFTPLWISSFLLWVLASLWLVSYSARAQNPAGEILALINRARLDQGLHPYVVGAELTAAAQRHSDDMATTGQISHTGSDGSSSTQRILEAGYGVYDLGPVTSENIYVGMGGADVPFNGWMEQAGARSNLLHEKYREVGIGVANDNQGRTFWTLDVGAQPNVLPVLIDDGATSVDAITVTLRLVPENVVPSGLGTAMGQPMEYRASTSPQFTGAGWAPWAEQVDFILDETRGSQTVYVQLRDATGRTSISQASVILGDIEITVTPTGLVETVTPDTPTETLLPTATPTLTPRTSPTPTHTATAVSTSTPTPTATSTNTPTPTPTMSATPQATLRAAAQPDTPSPTDTPTSVPSPTPQAESVRPRPGQSGGQDEPGTAYLSTATTSPSQVVFALTPAALLASDIEVEKESQPLSLAARLAPWAVGLQILALILGVYVALRRSGVELKDDTELPGDEGEGA